MSFFQEYSLLVAVATPVAVIVAINVQLYLSGERGTLLVPGVMSFPNLASEAATAPTVENCAPASAEAANDDHDRLAA